MTALLKKGPYNSKGRLRRRSSSHFEYNLSFYIHDFRFRSER